MNICMYMYVYVITYLYRYFPTTHSFEPMVGVLFSQEGKRPAGYLRLKAYFKVCISIRMYMVYTHIYMNENIFMNICVCIFIFMGLYMCIFLPGVLRLKECFKVYIVHMCIYMNTYMNIYIFMFLLFKIVYVMAKYRVD
jgi:hypothetical protein